MGLKDIKIGKTIEEIREGDSLTVTEIIEDKDLLLYLGLTNDSNPLYLQHDYTQMTKYKKPIVPIVLVTGILTSNVSKHLPGPGSNVVDVSISMVQPLYHNRTISFLFEVSRVDLRRDQVTIRVEGVNLDNERLLEAELIVEPPKKIMVEEMIQGTEEEVMLEELTNELVPPSIQPAE